jgi:ADP-ribose pyrophosphatase
MKERQLEPWQVLASREVFRAPPWISVSCQNVRLPDGRVVEDYHKIRLLDFALIVASTPEGRIIVERQYKHGIGKVTLVLPAGAVNDKEEPQAAAQRELLEETGYVAENWQSIGSFVANASYGCGTAHVFTAGNARLVSPPQSGDLEEMEILLLSPEELHQAIHGGQVVALSAAAAILLATSAIRRTSLGQA